MKVLIAGGYGFGNLGDEAILSVLLKKLNRMNASARILSFSPRETYAMHKSESIGYGRPLRTMHEIMTTDVLLIGGGGVFDTRIAGRTRRAMAWLYILLGYLAILTGRKIWLESISILTPDPITCSLLYPILKKADRISARDDQSQKILSKMSARAVNIVGDLTLQLKPADSRLVEQHLASLGAGVNRFTIGLALRSTGDPSTDQKISHLVDELASWAYQYSAQIVLIAFSHHRLSRHENDVEFLSRLRDKVKKKQVVTIFAKQVHPSILEAMIGRIDFLVGMRLQSLIMAHNMHVPMLAIAYHPKITLFANAIGAETLLPHELNEAAIKSIIDYANSCKCALNARNPSGQDCWPRFFQTNYSKAPRQD